ncbi:MAG: adenylosuccinate synthase [Flavobacteriales bacterium]|nr:adenylosuccinate synthase [Flavobacteriales bacterium]
MNKLDVLLGLQWGDEGKGKVVDYLTPRYELISRFQGGPNAGHTLEFNGIKHVLHTIPSGIFHEQKTNLIGNGVVLDPSVFKKEIQSLLELNVEVYKRLKISKKTHLILPTHKMLDAASELAKGKDKIGSTLRGIGPTYMDKTGRNGLRIGDILSNNFMDKYNSLKEKHLALLSRFDFDTSDLSNQETSWFEGIELIKNFDLIDSENYINKEIRNGKKVLAEGAQGSLLDIDFGSYPFVTSSNTISAGACTGLGVAPNRIGEVIGIFKAYCTRVGSGPFPTELHDDTGEELRKKGSEFGATTGRPRRCGWIDLPALRYSIQINGVTSLAIMKVDVLSGFDEIKACTHYELNGERLDFIPYDLSDENLKPVYKSFKGWDEEVWNIQDPEQLPTELLEYLDFLEAELETPINIVSFGPDRTQTLLKNVNAAV